MAKDKCIICNGETPYEFETHIDYRVGYVEGAGQLCFDCYKKDKVENTKKYPMVSDRGIICFPLSWVKDTPNDQELGGKIRNVYWEYKN